jgi:hypothetical protein
MKHEVIGSEGTEFYVKIPHGRKSRFEEIFGVANEEGTIQAWDARSLFASPKNHTTMSLACALRLAPCRIYFDGAMNRTTCDN